MTIEIHKPELETLIEHLMESGEFHSVKDALLHALTADSSQSEEDATGASLVAAMRACPVENVNLEPERFPMPVRNVSF